MKNFSDLGLETEFLRAIADLGFTEPTPVQAAAIPPGLAGRDVLACAMTGSGKTAAFLLPVLQRLKAKRRGATRALVLAPTRELAAQITTNLEELARHTQVRGFSVYGGVGQRPQENALRRGVDVVVACPGRLLDLMGQGCADFSQLEVLVLDEADRMLDMGFLPDIRRILKQLPRERQNLLFSATLPGPIVQLSREILHRPAEIDVQRASKPAEGVKQSLFPVPEKLKRALLFELLDRDEIGNALVFTRTKHRANRLCQQLQKQGINADRIHGNRSQSQRQKALDAFKSGRCRVLVATDIAARGIDVDDLSHVVNFDVPNVAEDYIHRVGRTARAQATGDAFTFVSENDSKNLRDIERAVGSRLPRRRLDGFDYGQGAGEALEVPLSQRDFGGRRGPSSRPKGSEGSRPRRRRRRSA